MADPTNTRTFETLIEDAKVLGAKKGAGADAVPQLYLKVVESAYHGTIDCTVDKHGAGVDDSTKITEAYVKARGSAAVFDSKADNQQTAASKVRAVVRAGGWTKGGSGEPLQTYNNLMNMRQTLRKDPANAKKLCDAGDAILKLSRTLVKRDTLPSDAELRQFCFKTEPGLKDNAELLVDIRKLATAMKDGKAQHNTVLDNSPEITAIINACSKRLKDIAGGKKPMTHKASNGVTVANTATP